MFEILVHLVLGRVYNPAPLSSLPSERLSVPPHQRRPESLQYPTRICPPSTSLLPPTLPPPWAGRRIPRAYAPAIHCCLPRSCFRWAISQGNGRSPLTLLGQRPLPRYYHSSVLACGCTDSGLKGQPRGLQWGSCPEVPGQLTSLS